MTDVTDELGFHQTTTRICRVQRSFRLSPRLTLIKPYKSVTLWHHLYYSNRLTTSQLIQQAYAPPSTTTTPEHLKRLQNDLFQIQKRPEAWGLVIPLLNHQDQNVQFFGAHTAQVKIARDW